MLFSFLGIIFDQCFEDLEAEKQKNGDNIMTVKKCLLGLLLFVCGCSDSVEYPIDKLKDDSSLSIFTAPPFNAIECYHDIDAATLLITVQSDLSLNDFTRELLLEGWRETFSSERKKILERVRPDAYEKMIISKQKGNIYQVKYRGRCRH